ncbi:hypothetical protein AAC03nite_19910 [Alicyclobacillus acidoterrestris]|nr:hypothetical protein AAC03nite_19910 [Alicyclobacillus acidoterrestris]
MNPTCEKCNVEGVRHGSSVDCPNCGMLLAITTAPHLHDEIETLREENRKLREIVERYMRIEQDLLHDCTRYEQKAIRYRDALGFYANKDNYYQWMNGHPMRTEQDWEQFSDDEIGESVQHPPAYDWGERARHALMGEPVPEPCTPVRHALRTLHHDFEDDNDHFMAAFIEAIEHGDAISALRIHELYMCFLNEDCPNREELIDERETIRKRY